VPRPTSEEKELFLQHIRDGDDRATAAWRVNPEYSGTMFRAMCNPQSTSNYDAEFSEAYDAAVEERGPLDPERQTISSVDRDSTSTTLKGHTKAMHLSDEQLEEFLELVRDGTQAWAAAQQLTPPTSMTQINRRASKDYEFAGAFREARDEGYTAYKEKLRAEATRQAFAGDYRALRDQMLMHLEEAKALITNRHEVGGIDGAAIRMIAERHFSDLPAEMLDEMIRTIEKRELGEIGPASG
jgi:hypothetical protein